MDTLYTRNSPKKIQHICITSHITSFLGLGLFLYKMDRCMIAWNIREKILCTSTLLAGFAWFSSCLVRPNQIERDPDQKNFSTKSRRCNGYIFFVMLVGMVVGFMPLLHCSLFTVCFVMMVEARRMMMIMMIREREEDVESAKPFPRFELWERTSISLAWHDVDEWCVEG